MKIYNEQNINELDWGKYINGVYARNYLLPLIQEGTSEYIENTYCKVQVLVFEQHIFPLVIGSGKIMNNSYVCSPYAQYVSYAKREMEIEFPNNYFKKQLSIGILNILGVFCKVGKFDQVVFVNNWLLSTNLYPNFPIAHITTLTHFLCTQFPQCTIVFRSVNVNLNFDFHQGLMKSGFKDVLSRQVYIINQKNSFYHTKKAFKIDVKFSKKREDYRWYNSTSILKEELVVIKKLYDDLYIKKYSSINPQFTLKFILNALKTGILEFQVLRHDGRIKAVIGFFMRDGVMTNPFVGYDISSPAEEGLYRLLTLHAINESERLKLIFNMSSGASKFKRIRGAEPTIEYNMVYFEHLPRLQQWPWKIFRWISHKVVIPMMMKYEL